MSKSCAFCNFKTDDEALFADHVLRVHGWGAPRPGRATPVVPGEDDTLGTELVTYCYACATPNASRAKSCVSCRSQLDLAPSGRRFGQVYALNHVETLVRSGFIDDATAEQLRSHYRAALGIRGTAPTMARAPSEPRPVPEPEERAVPVATPPPEPRAPAGPGLFSPERAPSLLLYVGAFLVVVAALIFVSVSGQQISGDVKLILLILGTIAFIGVGLFCHTYPRVLEAGRTFLFIGALLVPLDFLAYQVLISGQALAGSMIWTLGSLASAGLYAALAATGFGRLYSYFFLPAALSAVAGLESVLKVDDAWIFLPIAAVPLLLTLAGAVAKDERVQRVTAPLERAGSILATITLSMSAAVVPILGFVDSSHDRQVVPVSFVIAAIYYGLRARNGGWLDRWRAALGPAAVVLAFVYLLQGAAQTYGFALALLAVPYALTADAFRLGAPVRLPPWLLDRCERIALASAALAIVPMEAYWTAPLVGAIVDLLLAAGLAVVCVRRAGERTALMRLLLATSAVLLHLGVLLLAIRLGVIHAGSRPFTGLVERELAPLFAPLSAALGAAAWLARTRQPALRRDVAMIALASATATLLFAYPDPGLATTLGLAAAIAIAVAAGAAREPNLLWIAAGAGAFAAVCADRWLGPPIAVRPIALSVIATLVFVPATLRQWRGSAFAPVLRRIGLASAASAIAAGLLSLSTPLRLQDDSAWLATIPAVLILAAFGVSDGLLRRSEEQIVGSSAFFLGAALMVVARIGPHWVEAYAVPVAVYLALVAWGLAHWKMRLRKSLEPAARVAAALTLALPTYALTWFDNEATRGIIVLAEGTAIAAAAAWLADAELLWTGIGVLGIMLARAVAAPLLFETPTAAFGALILTFGLWARRIPSWRSLHAIHEPAEVVASLLVVLPPLARAIVRGPDALDQGATALALGVILVAIGLWSGRQMILATGLGAAAVVGVLALPDSARAEPYAAAAGVALLAMTLLAGRVLPQRVPDSHMWTVELTATALVLSGAAQRTFAAGGDAATRFALECIVLCALGLYLARPAVTYVATAGMALVAVWVLGDVNGRELHGTLTGGALVLLSLYAQRFTAKVDPRVLAGMETGGALLFIGPTLIAGWRESFFPRTPMVFFEIFLVLGAGVILGRRWLIAGALGALGLEALRALIDVVNRLPNYLLFALSGALLLGIGFVLLLKREAWRDFSERATGWWSRL